MLQMLINLILKLLFQFYLFLFLELSEWTLGKIGI